MRRTRNSQPTLPAFVELEKQVPDRRTVSIAANDSADSRAQVSPHVALNCPDQLAGDGVERVITP